MTVEISDETAEVALRELEILIGETEDEEEDRYGRRVPRTQRTGGRTMSCTWTNEELEEVAQGDSQEAQVAEEILEARR